MKRCGETDKSVQVCTAAATQLSSTASPTRASHLITHPTPPVKQQVLRCGVDACYVVVGCHQPVSLVVFRRPQGWHLHNVKYGKERGAAGQHMCHVTTHVPCAHCFARRAGTC